MPPLTPEEEAIRSALHDFKWGRGRGREEWEPPCNHASEARHVLETLEDAGWRLIRTDAERAARPAEIDREPDRSHWIERNEYLKVEYEARIRGEMLDQSWPGWRTGKGITCPACTEQAHIPSCEFAAAYESGA